MKFARFFFIGILFLSFSFPGYAQQTQPAPQPQPTPPPQGTPPSPPPEERTEIPVISIGNKVKPQSSEKPKRTGERRSRHSTPLSIPRDEMKKLMIEAAQLVHSKTSQVGDRVLFTVAENFPDRGSPLIAKGTPIVGKIVEMEKIRKDQPGRIKISLESGITPTGASLPMNGTFEVVRERGSDHWGGKEVFIPVGFRQSVPLVRRITSRIPPRASKTKSKGLIFANAEVEKGSVITRLGELKYPSKFDVYVEFPAGLDIANLKEDSFKLAKINDVFLPSPIAPEPGKIKVADHNKNHIQDIKYTFQGWDIIQFLPEGVSKITFFATTKEGKPIEAVASVQNEYR